MLIHSTTIVTRITNNLRNSIENYFPEQKRRWVNYKSPQTCPGSKSNSSKTQLIPSPRVVKLLNGVMLSRILLSCLCSYRRFYLEKSNQTDIFESNQADLEFAVEGLSELCEKPVEIIQEQNLKQVILDKAVYVKQRQGVLLEDTAKGLAEGRWELNVHAKN